MLVRIVKMSFDPTLIDDFLISFELVKNKIRAFEGCNFLELYQDQNDQNIFFTYSYWDSEIDLNNYRSSELFKRIWEETKVKFNGKPEAWSVQKLVSLA